MLILAFGCLELARQRVQGPKCAPEPVLQLFFFFEAPSVPLTRVCDSGPLEQSNSDVLHA